MSFRNRRVSVLLACLAFGVTGIAQQEKPPIPSALRLFGDPAPDLDLGALRMVSLPTRGADGVITNAPSLCLRAYRAKKQLPVPESSLTVPETLLGRPINAIEPWLRSVGGGDAPEIVITRHAVIVSLLPKGKVGPMTDEEIMRLRRVFPELSTSPTILSAQQHAHLWANRLLALDAALSDLLSLDKNGELTQDLGVRPLAFAKVELYLLPSPSQRDLLVDFIMGKEARPLVGKVLTEGLQPTPMAAMVIGPQEGEEAQRRFLFSATHQLLRRLRRDDGGLPDWLKIGISHFMERRLRKPKGLDLTGTLPADEDSPRNWDRYVGDLVLAGKAGAIAALTLTPERGLSLRSRLQAWSLVKYLVGLDQARFAKLVGILYRTPEDGVGPKALLTAIRDSHSSDIVGIESAWQQWVLKDRGS